MNTVLMKYRCWYF